MAGIPVGIFKALPALLPRLSEAASGGKARRGLAGHLGLIYEAAWPGPFGTENGRSPGLWTELG